MKDGGEQEEDLKGKGEEVQASIDFSRQSGSGPGRPRRDMIGWRVHRCPFPQVSSFAGASSPHLSRQSYAIEFVHGDDAPSLDYYILIFF